MAPRPGPKSCTKSRVARLQTSLRLMYPEMYFFSPPPLNPPLGFESSSKRRFARKVCGCGVCNGSAPQALRRHCDGAHVTLIKTHAYAHIHLSRKWRGWRSVFFFFFLSSDSCWFLALFWTREKHEATKDNLKVSTVTLMNESPFFGGSPHAWKLNSFCNGCVLCQDFSNFMGSGDNYFQGPLIILTQI